MAIKYRAYDKVKKEMIYDGLTFEILLLNMPEREYTQSMSVIGFSDEVLERFDMMPFISKCDSVGKEIYVGDFLKWVELDGPIYRKFEFLMRVVQQEDGSFCFVDTAGCEYDFDEFVFEHCTVVGSIYDRD